MKLDGVLLGLRGIEGDWKQRVFVLESGKKLACEYGFGVTSQHRALGDADCSEVGRLEDQATFQAAFGSAAAQIVYRLGPGGAYLDESATLDLGTPGTILSDMSIGPRFDAAEFNGWSATPIPFRVSLKGELQTIDIASAPDCARYAEGWVLDNGSEGMLVMRVPTGDALTCFVPLALRTENGRRTIQVGSLGPDGGDHRERSPYLDTPWPSHKIDLPTTRFIFFQGDWRTGFEVFRQMIASCIGRRPDPRRKPCPISYNTYHDFGDKYNREKLIEIMPLLSDMGFGLIHLDPGWETVWGSNQWGEQHMGDLESFVAEAKKHGLEVGCWTSVHCTDPDVHGDNYTRNQSGEKFYAEDFAVFNPEWNRLWGVCPASEWQNDAVAKLSRLGRAGFRFLNSDFHDWPWDGESCWYDKHRHKGPLTRAQWCDALNEMYVLLHRECPEMVIELHDHVESGAYRTPVWYLYDLPDSWDQKWAYEFMWHTYDDLVQHKLFSLYYVRLAEPIPLFLHMNASTDNEHAIAFWYVASCVNHIGVGAIVKSTEAQRAAYKRAFAEYNARFEAFTRGEFYGIDELTHVHVYPDRRRAVILVFNLGDEPVEREFTLDLEAWNIRGDVPRLEGAELIARGNRFLAKAIVPARGVAIVDLFL